MTPSNSSKHKLPLVKGSSDEPASTPPADPSHIKPAKQHDAAAPQKNPGNEEPDLALESDLPSDGRDEKGEAMIRDLPPRPELSKSPTEPDPSHHKP